MPRMQPDHDDEGDRRPRDDAEHLRERVELLLQRRRIRVDRGEHRRDPAHLGLHAGRRSRRIAPVPRVTEVFWKSMFVRSPSGDVAPRAAASASFGTGALSPVSAASCASSVADRTIRPSAGTMSPASTWTRSPGTTSTAGTGSARRRARPWPAGTCILQRVDARPGLQLLARPRTTLSRISSATMIPVETSPMTKLDGRDRDQHDVHRLAQLLQRDRPWAMAASPLQSGSARCVDSRLAAS